MPDGKSILSPLQLEANGCIVNDRAKELNDGIQPFIQTPDRHKFPLTMYHGLMHADVQPVQDDEWDQLPHVHLTADMEWDPSTYDHGVDKGWDTEVEEDPVEEHYRDLPHNQLGDLKAELEDPSDSD